MSKVATYTFLPWMRQGLANQITGQSGQRATIPVALVLKGSRVDGSGMETRPPILRDIEIYGPGDITGCEPRAIIKNEPNRLITNFEPNYLPYIEFYDEDLPWRYSPATPQNHRLMPWLALVVLKDGEFKDGKNIKDRPLPYLLTTATTTLPPPGQLWAFAHVHINHNLIGSEFRSTNAAAIESELARQLDADPDRGYARILSPRRLEPNSSYHAFLVPTFESGRLAGLGLDPAGAASFDTPAWSNGALPAEIPIYHRWSFRTGTIGDFEYLVRLLKPQPIDSRVGLRDMDVQKPGANIRGIVDAPEATDEQKLGGILKLGGALRIPEAFYTPEELSVVRKYDAWATLGGTQAYPHPFQRDLAAFINLTDEYEAKSAEQANGEASITEVQTAVDPNVEYDIGQNPDPLITAPLYGRWHALTKRLLKDRDDADLDPNDNWVHELNLDPRWRSAAGFGTTVVQENQEDYMAAAWEQIGEVLESNKRIKYAQLAKEVSFVLHQAHLKPANDNEPGQWLAVSAPLHARVMTNVSPVPAPDSARPASRMTVRHHIDATRVPRAALSTGLRKQLRPRGMLVKRLPFDDDVRPTNLIARINDGEVSAAPPRTSPPVLTGLEDAAEAAKPDSIPEFIADLLQRWPWLSWLPLLLFALLLILLLLLGGGVVAWVLGLAAGVALVFAWRVLTRWGAQLVAAASVLPENQVPESIDAWPMSPDFEVSVGGNSRRVVRTAKRADGSRPRCGTFTRWCVTRSQRAGR